MRLNRECEIQVKESSELSKLQISENEVKNLKMRLQKEKDEKEKLHTENEILRARIKKNDDQYANRKTEVEALIDLYLNDSEEDFNELCNRLKYR